MWNSKVLVVVATTTLLLCEICELDARKVVYIYDPPGSESEIYAQSHPGDFRILPVRSVPQQQQLQSPEQDQQIVTADAIRIIDPPKYVRNHHHNQREEEHEHSPQQFPNYQNPFGRGSTFKAPSYLPLPNKATQSDQHPQTLQSSYREHLGLQNPTPSIIRGQIGNLKERQKIYFPTEDNERPVRTKYRVKPVIEDQPIYGQSSYKPNRQNYRAGEDEYVVGNTFVVADNGGATNVQSAARPVNPYKHLASVRHEDNIRHQPREGLNPRIKERLRTEKTHTVYAEQGYDDKNFQNGDQQRYTTQFIKHRSKRATNNYFLSRHVERVEELPIALSLVSDQGQKLVGQDLLRHIANLIQDSKQLVPQVASNGSGTTEEMNSILVPSKGFQELYEKSVKVVSEPQNPTNHQPSVPIYLSANQHLPRAEKLQGAPLSPYQRTKAINCDYSPELQQNGKKKKTGQQIECLKEKYFAKEPLGEKFYEDQQVEQVNHPGAQGKNPSFLVYDDVMQTIESSRIKANPKYEGSQFGIDVNPETARFSEATLPIFDITKYFPQVYMIKPSGKVYGIKFKPNATPNIYNEGENEPKNPADIIKTPPKSVQYDRTIEERDQQHSVRTFEEPVSHHEEPEYGQQYQQEQKFTPSRQQPEAVRQHVHHQETHYPQQHQQHRQSQPQPQHQEQRHHQQQQGHHQQQQGHNQQQQGHHQQQQRYTHQGPSNHYHVQRQFVQQHPPKPQNRRPELINYNSYGPKPAQHGHPNPHGNPQRVNVPIAHIVKFVPEDAIRPQKQRL